MQMADAISLHRIKITFLKVEKKLEDLKETGKLVRIYEDVKVIEAKGELHGSNIEELKEAIVSASLERYDLRHA